MKSPEVFGLVLYKRLDFAQQPGQASLVGLFHAVRFDKFPTPPEKFSVYAALYDGEGEGTIELILTRLETEEEKCICRKWLTLPGRDQVVNLDMSVKHQVFPAPGRYLLALRFDQELLTRRTLEVFRIGT